MVAIAVLWSARIAPADPGAAPPSPATGTSGPSDVQSAAGATKYHCSIKVDNAHNSTHEPGTINVEAKASCLPTGMVVTLWNRNPPLRDIPVNSSGPIVGTYGRAAIPCLAGTYYGAADAWIVFPPRAIPPAGAIGDKSAAVPITC